MIHECCIYYLHHRCDELSRYHYQVLCQLNRFPVIPIHADQAEHLEEAVNVGRLPVADVWSNADLAFVAAFRQLPVKAKRYLWLEYDTLASMPIDQFYAPVWNEPAVAAWIRTPARDPHWHWFGQIPLLSAQLQPQAAGLCPISGILLCHAAMEALAHSELPPVFSELRTGTLLNAAGIPLCSLPPEQAANVHWFEPLVWPDRNKPGLYHPVKVVHR